MGWKTGADARTVPAFVGMRGRLAQRAQKPRFPQMSHSRPLTLAHNPNSSRGEYESDRKLQLMTTKDVPAQQPIRLPTSRA